MNEELEPQTPTPAGETTPQITPEERLNQVRAELELANKKAKEHEAQKEHWREKYERDIANVQINPTPSDDVFSDEGKAIVEKYVAPLQQTVESLQDQLALKDLQTVFPELKGLSSEFEQYRKEYPRHKLENVAKLFLQEKGLVSQPERKGLEPAGGGGRQPVQTNKLSAEDVTRLRTENPRKYEQMILSGGIRVEDIG